MHDYRIYNIHSSLIFIVWVEIQLLGDEVVGLGVDGGISSLALSNETYSYNKIIK